MSERPLRLLLVEDCEDDAQLTLRALRQGGYAPRLEQVCTAAALRAALASGPWDVVVTDFAMPGFDGREALAIVGEAAPGTPSIVVSGAIGEETAVELILNGARDVINKDRLARLAPAVERALAEAEVLREKRQLEAQLRQAQKMEAIGTLAGGVAHDFNNMLSPIVGYAEMLLEELPAGDKRRARAEAIVSAGERCRDLVHRLLAFARKQTLELRPLDLTAVVSGFETILRRTLPENIAIELRLAPAVGPVLGDSRQIEQVLLNLAVNARDAMPDGGRLLIETADVTLDSEYALAHEWVLPGPYVRLAVSDTGVGMDKQTLAKIFDPFFTTKEVGKGTGLGLAMVYGIVKQHGGSVEAESEPGRGTTFRVHFPRIAGAEAAPAAAGEVPRRRGGETVLIVEDEDQVLALAAEILRLQGYAVLEAGNAAQALAAVAAHPAGIDLLLTDVILTDANGKSLHERLAAGGSRHAVLYMSGYPADVIGRHGVLDAGVALITKPFSLTSLAAKVREVLDRKA